MAHNTSTFGRIRTSNAFITLVICTAIFSDTFVYDLIIPFMPKMLEGRLNLPPDQVQVWTSTLLAVFGGAFAVGTVIAGYLTDYSPSAKFPFLLGMITMIASSLMFFLGQQIAVTIVARLLQGLSASFVWVSGIAYLNTQIKPSYIGTAMGYVTLAMAAGEIAGPLVGGVMYEHAGHFAVLALVCAILGVDVILRLLLKDRLPKDLQQHDSGPDDSERPLLNGNTDHETDTSDSTAANGQGQIEGKYISIFGFRLDSDLCASFYAAVVIGTLRDAFDAALSNFVFQRFSWSTTASGGVLFVFLSPAILGPVLGRYTTNHGPRWFTVIALGVVSIALVVLGFLSHPSTVVKVFFVIVVAVIGTCVSSLATVQTIAFSVAAKRKELAAKQAGKSGSTGTTFGGFSLAWTLGMFLGPLIAEVFIDHVSWLAFNVFLASMCAVSAIVMAFTWKEWEIFDEE